MSPSVIVHYSNWDCKRCRRRTTTNGEARWSHKLVWFSRLEFFNRKGIETKRKETFKKNEQEQSPVYVLGHSDDELDSLIQQSRIFSDLTELVFLNAGITNGMRVLDLGCGPGDVSFLAAKLVGPSGVVIGIDKSTESIAAARSRVQARQGGNAYGVEALPDVHQGGIAGPADEHVSASRKRG